MTMDYHIKFNSIELSYLEAESLTQTLGQQCREVTINAMDAARRLLNLADPHQSAER